MSGLTRTPARFSRSSNRPSFEAIAPPDPVSEQRGPTSPVITGTRWDVVTRLIAPDSESILDIGCRGKELQHHLSPDMRYVGLDLHEPADVVASAEEPLPFDSGSFECVVIADVLEHLENAHGALDEAMRVASRSVVLLLPNVYTLWLRLRYLVGMTMGKYEFSPEFRVDRHRWLMNYDQARAFTRGRAATVGWHVAREFAYLRRFRRPDARLAYGIARIVTGPNVWAWEYAARLEPAETPSGE